MDADAQSQLKTLEEFLSSVEDAVSRGAVPDPAPIIAQGETYPALRDFFLKRPELVTEWLEAATEEDGLRAAKKFISYKKNVFESSIPDLKQLRHEKEMPSGPVSPVREKAIADARSELLIHQKQKEGNAQSEYARKVVQNFVVRLREQRLYGTPEDIEKAVDRELKKPVYAATEKEAEAILIENISQAPEFSQDRHAAKTIAENVFGESKEFVAERQRETIINVAAAKKIIEDETLIDGKTFVETLTKNSIGNNQPIGEQLDYAVAAARASTVVNAPHVDAEGMRVGGILTTIPGVKEAAIEQAFANAWARTVLAEGSIETLTTRFGAQVVRSDEFQKIIRSGTDVAQQKHAAGAVVGSLGKIAGDVLVSVKGPPSEDMLHYISALYEKQARTKTTTSTSPTQFIVTMLYTYTPSSFSAGGGLSNWVLRWGAQKAMSGAAKGAGKAIVEKAAVGGAAKVIGGAAGTALGGPVGTVVGSVLLDKVFSFGGKILGGITGGLGFLASGSWLSGEALPLSSEIILLPTIIGIIFLFLFLSPTFFNIQNFPDVTRRSALVTSYSVGSGGNEEGGIIDCEQNPDDPQCKVEPCIPQKVGDCAWPTSGIITQGPFAHCVIDGQQWSTHDKFDAIDIAAGYNTQVISIKSGEIVAWAGGCPDEPGAGNSQSFGCNGGWGNYVKVSSDDGYVLIYAHMAHDSMGLTHLHMNVNQGQVIGRVDNNGNSYGNHLHFGVVSGPHGILSVIPLSPSDAQKVNGCGYNSRCPVVCPNIQTSIQ